MNGSQKRAAVEEPVQKKKDRQLQTRRLIAKQQEQID